MMHQRGTDQDVDQGRISAWQLALLLITIPAIQDGTAVNHWLASRVGNDQWISILIAIPFALAGIVALVALGNRHPNRGLADIMLRLVGPLAYPLGLFYAALFLADATLTLRQFGTLSRLLSFMNLTPYMVFAVALMVPVVWGAWLGIEVLARVNALVLLCVDIPLGAILTGLSVNHWRLARVQPILAHGMDPVLWGTWLVIGKFGELVLLLVFLPLVAEGRSRAKATNLWGVLLISAMALAQCMGPVLAFGPSVNRIQWPWYSQIRSIVTARFIENLDWFAVILWVHGFLVEISTFMYASALILARLFGVRGHRAFIPPLGVVILAASFFVGRTQPSLLYQWWMLDAYGFVGFGWILPLMLLGVSLLRTDRT